MGKVTKKKPDTGMREVLAKTINSAAVLIADTCNLTDKVKYL